MDASKKLLCPSCRGFRMVLGQQEAGCAFSAGSSLFRPTAKPVFVGFQIYRVACLDCGYVGTSLSEDERSALETKLRAAPRVRS